MLRWVAEGSRELRLSEIGEHYGRYRLHLPEAERAMARSLERYGQLSPVVVCQREDRYELIDGFKRLGAARTLARLSHLSARLLEADERTAKAAIYGLNRAGGRTRELEEAWIIQALVREDGLSQVEVAELLGRHKSWVCRRLALIERLGSRGARGTARGAALAHRRAADGTVAGGQPGRGSPDGPAGSAVGGRTDGRGELAAATCTGREQQAYVLAQPREALSQTQGFLPAVRDPRLSEAGNQVGKRLGVLLDLLGRMEVWLAHRGRTGLTPEDRAVLSPRFQRLAGEAGSVAALSQDLVSELERP